MKNKCLSLGFIMICTVASAQFVPQTQQTPAGRSGSPTDVAQKFKSGSGDKTFEMNFNPLSATPLSLNYIRARFFTSDNFAVRTGVSLALKSNSDSKAFDFALLPGIEKHFEGTEKLSPYMGAELVLAGRFSSSSVTSNSITTAVKGAWLDGSNTGFFTFGLNALIGTDYYFSKHIYVGIEAGFGLSLISSSDVVTTVTPNGGATTSTTKTGGSNFQFGPNYNSAIRIGFAF
jgi:hypothetical protein